MVANLLKQEIFVREEMVLQSIPLTFKYGTRLLAKMFEYLCFCFMAGRGVDLNRNWSVDWGKKEKVRS